MDINLGKNGYFDLYASQAPAPPPSQIWTPPEIDFFDVSDDLEQKKKKFFFLVQKKFFLDLENFSIFFFFFANFFFWFYNECEPNPLPPAKLF